MINPHPIANMGELVRIMVLGAEGHIERQPRNVGDHTVTYGYGYTFIQHNGGQGAQKEWFISRTLAADLAAINVTLTPTELADLRAIRNALNQYQLNPTQNNLNQVDTLINQFCAGWGRPDLTDPLGQTLYNQVIGRKGEAIRGQFIAHLGEANGNALYQALQNTREMAGLLDLAYNGEGLIGQRLTRALWNGDRAEAWFQIRYDSNNGNDLNLRPGLAKRRYMEAQFIGLFYDPSNPTMREVTDAFKMLQRHRREIIQYESLYGIPLDGSNPTEGNRIEAANMDYGDLIAVGQACGLSDVLSIEQSLNEFARSALINDLRAQYQKELRPQELAILNPGGFRSVDIYLNPAKQGDPIGHRVSEMAVSQSLINRNSLMIGMDQTDKLSGGNGDDVLIGEAGRDILVGGIGSDLLIGGSLRRIVFLGLNGSRVRI